MTRVGDRIGASHRERVDRYAAVSGSLAVLSDRRLARLVDEAEVVGSGIGGTLMLLQVDGAPVLAKCVPLTDIERRPENVMSTANVFGLPVCCQYGVGSPSFGVWRELAAHTMTSSWVLGRRSEGFPLLYHWRVLDRPASAVPLTDELADVDRAVEYWHGSAAVRQRIEAILRSSAVVVLFLEHLPLTLPGWLEGQVAIGGDVAEASIVMVERGLRRGVASMNAAGLFHFDTHLDNIVTDAGRLYFTDFGLATSTRFDLSPTELSFLAANSTHDACLVVTRLVDWLVTNLTGVGDWMERDALVRRCAEGHEPPGLPPAAATVVKRYAPVATVVNDFYRQLHLEDRTTPYPADDVDRACASCGFDRPRWLRRA